MHLLKSSVVGLHMYDFIHQLTSIYTYIHKNLQNGNNNKAQSYDCRYTHLHLIFSKEPTLTSVPTKFLYDVYLFSKGKY